MPTEVNNEIAKIFKKSSYEEFLSCVENHHGEAKAVYAIGAVSFDFIAIMDGSRIRYSMQNATQGRFLQTHDERLFVLCCIDYGVSTKNLPPYAIQLTTLPIAVKSIILAKADAIRNAKSLTDSLSESMNLIEQLRETRKILSVYDIVT
jgi:hypothetical protein